MLGEELFDRGTECIKEIALYTPSGAALLSQVTVLPAEVTHLMFIFCCPLIVILVKRHVERNAEHKAAIREGRERQAERGGKDMTHVEVSKPNLTPQGTVYLDFTPVIERRMVALSPKEARDLAADILSVLDPVLPTGSVTVGYGAL